MATGSILDAIPVLAPGVVLDGVRDVLGEDEWRIASRVDGTGTLGDIAVAAGMPGETARRVGLFLSERGIVVLTESSTGEADAAVDQMDYLEDAASVPINGVIEPVLLPKLLIRLNRAGVTGVLQAHRTEPDREGRQVVKHIYLDAGRIIDCRTHPFNPAECLGRVLQQARRLDKGQVVESLRMVKEDGVRQGEALVRMGAITPPLLDAALTAQLEYKIGGLFEWPGIRSEFVPQKKLSPRVARIEASLPQLIFNAVWKRYPQAALEAYLAPYREKFVGRADNPPFDYHELGFEEILGEVWYDTMKVDLPLKRLLILSPLGPERTHRLVMGLYMTGFLTFLDETREDPAIRLTRKLEAQIRDMGQYTHFDNIAVHWSAGTRKVNQGYKVRAREIQDEMERAPESVRPLYERIMAIVDEAYTVLNDPDTRRAYRQKAIDQNMLRSGLEALRRKAENLLFADEDYAAAAAELETALEVRPSEGEYLALQGLATLLDAGTDDREMAHQARNAVERACKIKPGSDVAHMCRGIVYRITGQTEAARKALQQAVKLNGDNALARIELVGLDKELEPDKREKAIEAYLTDRASHEVEDE